MIAWRQPSSYLSWLSHMLCRLDWGARTLFDLFLDIYMQPCLRIYTCQKLFSWEKSKNRYDHKLQSNLYMSRHGRGVFKGQVLVTVPSVLLHMAYDLSLVYTTPCLWMFIFLQANLFYSQEYCLVRWMSKTFLCVLLYLMDVSGWTALFLTQLAMQKLPTSPLMITCPSELNCYLIVIVFNCLILFLLFINWCVRSSSLYGSKLENFIKTLMLLSSWC